MKTIAICDRGENKPYYEITPKPLKGPLMARKKPYTGGLLVLDLILTLLTSGGWLVVVLFREMYRRS